MTETRAYSIATTKPRAPRRRRAVNLKPPGEDAGRQLARFATIVLTLSLAMLLCHAAQWLSDPAASATPKPSTHTME